MKGFPSEPVGPRGPWYKKVNEAVAEACNLSSERELLELLGHPDLIVGPDKQGPSSFFESIGSLFKFGDKGAETTYVYRDPYRPRHRYNFSLVKGKVISNWRETVTESNANDI